MTKNLTTASTRTGNSTALHCQPVKPGVRQPFEQNETGEGNMALTQSSIKSEERSLGQILSDGRPLRVPTYQRNFSWGKAQITDLWDDIQRILYDSPDNYFLGSMVFIQREGNSLDVVDGQQRLATVSLLLAAIRDGFIVANDSARAQHVEYRWSGLLGQETGIYKWESAPGLWSCRSLSLW